MTATLAMAALLVVARLQEPGLQLTAYPVNALAYVERNVDVEVPRMAAPEGVGNLLTYIYGADGRVFYDDRFDMFPDEVSAAALALHDAPRVCSPISSTSTSTS